MSVAELASVEPEEFELAPPEPPEAEAPKYTFDEAFQGKIVAMSLRDTKFMQGADSLVKPDYFESPTDGMIVSLANRYFDQYKRAPADITIIGALLKKDVVKKVVPREQLPFITARIKELMKSDISDRDFVLDEVGTFARHQAVSAAILASVDHLDRREFDRISTSLKKALDVGVAAEVPIYEFGARIVERTETRIDRKSGKLPPSGISTGFPDFDRHLYHKGWGKRELSVIMGSAKAGKTTALMEFGKNAASNPIKKQNVLYVTLEVSAAIIADRLDAAISNQIMMELDLHIGEVKEKIEEWTRRSGRFDIAEFPTGSMRVSDLRRLLERKKAEGIVYDLVIVDYADLIAPERVTDNAIENSKSVYVNLRGLAMIEDVAILTATQTNREGAKKMVATATDVADDFNKIRIADIVISINKSDEERRAGQARLFFAAVRNGRSNFTIRIQQDVDRMRFCTEVLGEE